jgi:hypothetical protein
MNTVITAHNTQATATTTNTTTTATMASLFEHPLTEEVVIALIASDIPTMTESQLAALLTEIYLAGPSVVGGAIAPIARVELARRNFISQIESAVLVS